MSEPGAARGDGEGDARGDGASAAIDISKITVVRTIGTDPAELERVAEEVVVQGKVIEDAEIADLRALIEAVQGHPMARLAILGPYGKALHAEPTRIIIRRGIVRTAQCNRLDIGVPLYASTIFEGTADFSSARFAAVANFVGAFFLGNAEFHHASFAESAAFADAFFAGDATFDRTRFSEEAGFGGTSVMGSAEFKDALFAAYAWFKNASFAGDARFDDASFEGDATFDRVSFVKAAHFSGTSFAGYAWFDDASFAGGARFEDAAFAADIDLDARFIDVRQVHVGEFKKYVQRHSAALAAKLRKTRSYRTRQLILGPASALYERLHIFRDRTFTWTRVRALGSLALLNRVSVLALLVVPLVAGAWPTVRVAIDGPIHALSRASERTEHAAAVARESLEPLAPDRVQVILAELESAAASTRRRLADPSSHERYLPSSLALAFFAAAFVAIGQLIYQMMAPEEIKKQDEDAFTEAMHKRYSEGAPDRDDGLRRATDAIAAIAKERPDRHANFVIHHGETVWIPPKTRIDWFKDPEPEKRGVDAEVSTDAHVRGLSGDGGRENRHGLETRATEDGRAAGFVLPQGCIPGAERARIAIEEGARAEYWMKSRQKLGWACATWVCYAAGLLILTIILVRQAWNIGVAAGWW